MCPILCLFSRISLAYEPKSISGYPEAIKSDPFYFPSFHGVAHPKTPCRTAGMLHVANLCESERSALVQTWHFSIFPRPMSEPIFGALFISQPSQPDQNCLTRSSGSTGLPAVETYTLIANGFDVLSQTAINDIDSSLVCAVLIVSRSWWITPTDLRRLVWFSASQFWNWCVEVVKARSKLRP
jgi:hypothetical protein